MYLGSDQLSQLCVIHDKHDFQVPSCQISPLIVNITAKSPLAVHYFLIYKNHQARDNLSLDQ